MNYLEIIQSKIHYDKLVLTQLLAKWRFQDQKIVFSNGCFDILHKGHVEYLTKAASLGDHLVLGLNTDASVKKLKGPLRPLQDETSRAQIMASLQFIAAVVLFDEETPYELIKFIQPDILVKGGDYKPEDIVGADIVKNNGGEIITIELSEGYSTSGIVEKARKI
ncbi:MAG: D-glycero-beta-D-manno-heptose 1-phosphate adenylyltransferase [Bacteroidetes bacterium]|jgi:rfaE bifunctional protein nucleotidyltransferase chain/domain|nr:D-glycero-beta-D-manno-heptose 1-phosphate adenylyltransferase [Bacteroidota bacterium]